MTPLEEKVIGGMSALLLMGIGWIGAAIMSNNEVTTQNQLSLAENRVLLEQNQIELRQIMLKVEDSATRIAELDREIDENEQAINRMAQTRGL